MNDVVAAPASRNSPCPCGSGRRYKDCHGALAGSAQRTSPSPSAPAAYRAPGSEWTHLDEATRDLLGARMMRALALQRDGRVDDAAREYREVIAAAPNTHDALHMLGVIEWGRGALDEAEELIANARALRPPYAAIEHNWQLVQDARLARERALPEQLAERALPILVDLALAPRAGGRDAALSRTQPARSAAAPVHLIGRVHSGDHDDGWLMRRLAAILDANSLTLWAADGDGTEMIGARRTRRVDEATASFPRGGTHVFVGVDFDCAPWIDRASAERVIVFCQPTAPTRYLEQLRAIAHDGARPLELVFPSQGAADRFGRRHRVMMPPLDFVTPRPAARQMREAPTDGNPACWSAGIVGQYQQLIGEPPDLDFIKAIASSAGRLDIYDSGRLRYALGASRIARFFERTPEALATFLAGLGCFVHRADTWWQETLGRELYGAMLLGVPVLCPLGSVHAERIEHGVDGFIYASGNEAQQQIRKLRDDPALAQTIGRAGRDKIRALADPQAQASRYRELVFGATPAIAPAVEWMAPGA